MCTRPHGSTKANGRRPATAPGRGGAPTKTATKSCAPSSRCTSPRASPKGAASGPADDDAAQDRGLNPPFQARLGGRLAIRRQGAYGPAAALMRDEKGVKVARP